MNNLVQFKVRQIVWAKVEEFPWWPGRVFSRFYIDNEDRQAS